MKQIAELNERTKIPMILAASILMTLLTGFASLMSYIGDAESKAQAALDKNIAQDQVMDKVVESIREQRSDIGDLKKTAARTEGMVEVIFRKTERN